MSESPISILMTAVIVIAGLIVTFIMFVVMVITNALTVVCIIMMTAMARTVLPTPPPLFRNPLTLNPKPQTLRP